MKQIKIERLGHLGHGIAAGPVYVPGALPGEVVEGEIVGGVMEAPRIVTPVAQRVAPSCRHAKSCGGCQLQHVQDTFVADWKVAIVREALAAHGLAAEIRPCITSKPRSRRRATFSAKRTKKGALAGFHQKKSDVIVAVPDCQLVHTAIAGALGLVEQLAVLGASRKGELSVLVTLTEAGLDIVASGGKSLDAEAQLALAQAARDHDLARLTWGNDLSLVRRPPFVRFGRAQVAPPPGAFLQATPDGEAALVAAVRDAVGPARRIVDLFAGCGTFALPLAEQAEVFAVEGDPAMIKSLDQGWRQADGLKRVTHAARDLFREPLQSDELSRFDAVVIDPPRAGAEAQTAQIALARVPRVAFVSCNPVTFARDASTLILSGYRLDWVQVVDQFRWSTHVELAASFVLEN